MRKTEVGEVSWATLGQWELALGCPVELVKCEFGSHVASMNSYYFGYSENGNTERTSVDIIRPNGRVWNDFKKCHNNSMQTRPVNERRRFIRRRRRNTDPIGGSIVPALARWVDDEVAVFTYEALRQQCLNAARYSAIVPELQVKLQLPAWHCPARRVESVLTKCHEFCVTFVCRRKEINVDYHEIFTG